MLQAGRQGGKQQTKAADHGCSSNDRLQLQIQTKKTPKTVICIAAPLFVLPRVEVTVKSEIYTLKSISMCYFLICFLPLSRVMLQGFQQSGDRILNYRATTKVVDSNYSFCTLLSASLSRHFLHLALRLTNRQLKPNTFFCFVSNFVLTLK